MKPLILIVLLTFCTTAMGQTFEDDWNSFSLNNWEVEFSSDTTKLFGKESIGEVNFVNSSLDETVTYSILLATDIDSAYFNEIENWYLLQSECFYPGSFPSIEIGDFYYQPKMCIKCGLWKDVSITIVDNGGESPRKKGCKAIYKKLSQYNTEPK